MRHQNIVRFREEINGINWDNVVDKENAQENYPTVSQNPTDYRMQNVDTIFNINPVTEDEIVKIMGQPKHSAAG